MKKIIAVMVVAVAAAVSAQAADVSASVDFASAYVFRGVTLNNGLVMQPGVEVSGFPMGEEYGSLAVGMWANYDINDEDYDGSDFSEIDYYMSYTLPVEAIDISMGYIEYTYPTSAASTGSDKELNLTIGSAIGTNGLYSSVTVNYGVDGVYDDCFYITGALDYETALSDALTASAGVTVSYLVSEGGLKQTGVEDGFSDATASVGLSYALSENWSVNGGLTYIAQLSEDSLPDSVYDVGLVASVGVSCDF